MVYGFVMCENTYDMKHGSMGRWFAICSWNEQ